MIRGTVQVGETLTADTSSIADEDGLTNVSYSYQWLADDTAIQGATNSTYTLADADEGKAISVQVSFSDDAGNEESLIGVDATAWSATMTSGVGLPNSRLRVLFDRRQGGRVALSGLIQRGRHDVHREDGRNEGVVDCTSAWTGNFPSTSCWSWMERGSFPMMRPSGPTATATSIGGKERA